MSKDMTYVCFNVKENCHYCDMTDVDNVLNEHVLKKGAASRETTFGEFPFKVWSENQFADHNKIYSKIFLFSVRLCSWIITTVA